MRRLDRDLRSVLVLLLLATLCACAKRPGGAAQELDANHLFRPTQKAVISSPVAHDWDGDGHLEIAIGARDGYLYLVNDELADLPGWPKYSPQGYSSSPALADLDGDDQPEIIVGSDTGQLYAWHFDGRAAQGFPIKLGYRCWSSPAVLPGPMIAIGGLRKTFVFDAQGRDAFGWPQPMPNWAGATPAIGPDIIAIATLLVGAQTAGALCAWHWDGRPYIWSPLPLKMDSDSSPAIADLDGDGRVEIIMGDDEGLLHVIDLDGRELPGFPQRAESLIEASPAIADMDDDGMLDIVVGSWDGKMYVWNYRGEALPGWPVQVEDQIISSAALVDLDGDGKLDIVAGSKDKRLYAWTARGAALQGFPRDLGHHILSSPWVGDVNGDGYADIVVGANNGIHLLRNVGPLGRAAWPMFHRDAQHTGYMP